MLSKNRAGRCTMAYTQVALEDRILDMYPEIRDHSINLSLNFDEEKNTWIIKFRKDHHELTTHLEKNDADDCMEGRKCVYLGVQLGEFMKNFEGG
jgi:hypothetical protein